MPGEQSSSSPPSKLLSFFSVVFRSLSGHYNGVGKSITISLSFLVIPFNYSLRLRLASERICKRKLMKLMLNFSNIQHLLFRPPNRLLYFFYLNCFFLSCICVNTFLNFTRLESAFLFFLFLFFGFQVISAPSGVAVKSEGIRRNSTLICVPLMADSVDQMVIQMNKAKLCGADLVEVRLDSLNTFTAPKDIQTLINQCPLPTLFTYRSITATTFCLKVYVYMYA